VGDLQEGGRVVEVVQFVERDGPACERPPEGCRLGGCDTRGGVGEVEVKVVRKLLAECCLPGPADAPEPHNRAEFPSQPKAAEPKWAFS
jgi:hypothetical protein